VLSSSPCVAGSICPIADSCRSSTVTAMGQACTPREPGKAMAVEDLSRAYASASGSSCSTWHRAPQLGALGLCRGELAECSLCNCVDKGFCCCAHSEERFGHPWQAAQSQSQAAESTLVLHPGHDQYISQVYGSFHTVVQLRPQVGYGAENATTDERPQPTGEPSAIVSSVPFYGTPECSPRSWTTAESENSETCLFEPMAPAVRTRRPPSVPPLALPGGVAIGSVFLRPVFDHEVLKWPLEVALSEVSGKSATFSFSDASKSIQASSKQPSRTGHNNHPEPWKAPKMSKPCSPALCKVADGSPTCGGEECSASGPDLSELCRDGKMRSDEERKCSARLGGA